MRYARGLSVGLALALASVATRAADSADTSNIAPVKPSITPALRYTSTDAPGTQQAWLALVSRGKAISLLGTAYGHPRWLVGEIAIAGSDPRDAAERFLQNHAKSLLPEATALSWAPLTERTGKLGTYLRFQQLHRALPVFGGEIVVLVDTVGGQRSIRLIKLATLATETVDATDALIDATTAQQIALEALSVAPATSRANDVRLGFDPDHRMRLAYRVRIDTITPFANWELMVDAQSGAVLSRRDRVWRVDGTGMVFDPNPVASTGNTALTDGGDANSPALDAARFAVTLPRLDGSGFLRGDFADAHSLNVNQRAFNAGLAFSFQRNSDLFEEAMAYFHIDRVQNRIQTALGFNGINNRRQEVIVNFSSADNSFYSPADKILRFGFGGVDDAEDADLIVHEYGHSILDNQVPGFGGGGDAGALGEGFGDYLAASMLDMLSPEIVAPECIADWDATAYDNGTPPCLRRVDSSKHYPEFAVDEVHEDGAMWSAALWRVRQLVGADNMDELVLESNFALSTNETFFSAADALLATDLTLNAGAHSTDLRRSFIRQGLSRQLTPVSPLTLVETSVAVSVDSPRSGGLYPNLTDDTQTIIQPGAAALRVHFSQFDTLDTDISCLASACDNVYLTNAAGDLFQILNGNLGAFSSVTIPGDTVRIRLVSDASVQRFGYHIDSIDVMDDVIFADGFE